jgi:hypothetical protein
LGVESAKAGFVATKANAMVWWYPELELYCFGAASLMLVKHMHPDTHNHTHTHKQHKHTYIYKCTHTTHDPTKIHTCAQCTHAQFMLGAYAPLFGHAHLRTWHPNLILFNSDGGWYGTPSYEVQKLFMQAVGPFCAQVSVSVALHCRGVCVSVAKYCWSLCVLL